MKFNLPLSQQKDLHIDTSSERPLSIRSWPGGQVELTKQEALELLALLLEHSEQILQELEHPIG